MLQFIHKHLKGWFAFLVFTLITCSFLIWGVAYYLQSMQSHRSIVAKVDGQSITAQEINRLVKNFQSSAATEKGGVLTQSDLESLKTTILQQLIAKAALFSRAEKRGGDISSAQLNMLITEIPAFQIKGRFSPELFQRMLYTNGVTQDEFLQQLKENLLIAQVKMGLTESQFILPSELKRLAILTKQTRSAGYFIVTPKQFEADIKVTDTQLKKYFDEHQKEFESPERASFEYLLLSPKKIDQAISVSEEEAEQYYQDNQEIYYTPSQWEIEEIVLKLSEDSTDQQIEQIQQTITKIIDELKTGQSFEEVMKNHQGKKEWVSQNEIDQRFASVLTQMRPGQISKPFQTQGEVRIVKLISLKPRELRPFSEVSDQVKKSLKDQKTQDLFSQKSDELSNLTYTNNETLQVAADALNLKVESTPLLTRSGSSNGITSEQEVLSTAFSNAVLIQKNNSNPIILKNGDLVVIRAKEYEGAHIPPFNQIISKVKEKYTAFQAEEKAKRRAELLQKSLLQGDTTPQSLAKRYRLIWNYRRDLMLTAQDVPQPVLFTVFSFKPPTNQKEWTVTTVTLDNGELAVIGLKNVTLHKDVKLSLKERDSLEESFIQENGELIYQLYLNDTIEHAKVKHYNINGKK